MYKTNIKKIRFYDGSRTAKEVMSEAIACKVKKILRDDIENKRRKEYNRDSSQNKNTESLSVELGG